MSLLSHPCRSIAASIALGAFSIGLFASFGAAAIDKHTAVTEVREAAAEVESRRSALAVSVKGAQQVSRQAASLSHEDEVLRASDALDAAIDDAAAIASAAEQTVRSGATSDSAELVAALFEEHAGTGATTVADVQAPAPSAIPSPSAEPTISADAEVSADQTEQAASDPDAHVPKVLEGEIDSPAEARAAAEHLELAQAALDNALEAVEREAQALADAAEAAQHAEDILSLDEAVPALQGEADTAADLLEGVDGNVEDTATVDATQTAIDDAAALIADLDGVDRDDAGAVGEAVAEVALARETLDTSLDELQVSHEAWVETENAARTAANEILVAENEAAVAQARKDHAAANRAAVSSHANGWSGQPSGVSGSNGRLAAGSLCKLSFASGHQLQCDAASALEDADAAYYAQTGQHLSLTDSYRSYGLQVTTRARKPGTAAIPGTSNHGWGMAVDLDYASASWLAENGADYGWVHPVWARPGGSRPEWWHLEYVATSVGAFEAPAPEGLQDLVESVFPAETDEESTEA